METTAEGAWRSFAAAFICLPAFFALRFMSSAGELTARAVSAELIGYAIAWAGFALISLAIARGWGLEAAWPRFITAWNWATIIQYLALFAAMLPGALGLPAPWANLLALAGLGYALWLEWFVARAALGLNGGRAALLVAIDQAFGLFAGGLIRTLSAG
jgi:hypothetical protein